MPSILPRLPEAQRLAQSARVLNKNAIPADKLVVPLIAKSVTAREVAAQGLGKLPPFSPVLNRLLATLSQDNVAYAKIAELIEKDPVLAGNVLSLVNSALYARSGRVNSVRHAVSLLGINKLRNAALGMSVTKMWGKVHMPAGWSMQKFNEHSIAAAILCDMLSQQAAVEYPEGAFVAGLLHDLGALVLAFVNMPVPPEVTPAEISAEALACWNLPKEIQTAVRFQDHPESDRSGTSDTFPLSWLIASANSYLNSIGIVNSDDVQSGSVSEPFRMLGIDAEIPRILEEFHQEFEAIRAVL